MKQQAQVFIQMGPGGVGKTTISAAFGICLAKLGHRVLVMTIDPSKRLAQALGIQGQSGVATVPIKLEKGKLSAMVLNHAEIFDNFVRRASKESPAVEKLMNNKLYIALKTKLQGTQDFTALMELYNKAQSGEFDVVILDTPPAEHAWQFLESPEKLAALFQDKVAKWFRWVGGGSGKKTIWAQLINAGTEQVFKILEILTGKEFVVQIAEFFRSIQGFQSQILERVMDSRELLKNPKTEFTLVTTQDELKLKESVEYAQEMKTRGYQLKRVMVNRAWPEQQDVSLDQYSAQEQKEIKSLLNLLSAHQKANQKIMKSWPAGVQVLKVYDTLKSSNDLARLEEMADDMLKAFQ